MAACRDSLASRSRPLLKDRRLGGESASQHPPEPRNRFGSVVRACARCQSCQFGRKISPVGVVSFTFGPGMSYLLRPVYFLSLTLESIPISVVYAVWSGVGIAVIAVVSVLFLDQKLDLAAMIGLGLIIAGVVVLRLYSEASVE